MHQEHEVQWVRSLICHHIVYMAIVGRLLSVKDKQHSQSEFTYT